MTAFQCAGDELCPPVRSGSQVLLILGEVCEQLFRSINQSLGTCIVVTAVWDT